MTITATSTTNPSQVAIATITITQVGISITTPPPASMPTGAQASVAATVTNDPQNLGVDWAVTCGGGSSCGSFNPAHTASGVATTYTAPNSVPTGNTVTISAAATAAPTSVATATVPLPAPYPSQSLLTPTGCLPVRW